MNPRQKGAALLMAMLMVALVAMLAANGLWQQWRTVEIESAQRARAQSLWILGGALDWARLILREDARAGAVVDHLGEPWAVPLAESRLSTFLAADRNAQVDSTDIAEQVFLSGQIRDAQSRLNVSNLVQAGAINPAALAAFGRLFEQLGLARAELDRLAENLRFAQDLSADNGSSAQAPLLPQRMEQLVWLGLSPSSLEKLRPHITVLPVATPVNLNTANATVLWASLASISQAQAQGLVLARQSRHFETLADVSRQLGLEPQALQGTEHSVGTRFFEITGRLRLENTVVLEHSLVQRDHLLVRALWRQRGVDIPQLARDDTLLQ